MAAVPIIRAARVASLAFALALPACVSDATTKRVEAAEAAEAAEHRQVERLAVDAAQLAAEYDQVTAEYVAAAERFRRASAIASTASNDFSAAQASWQIAERNWRWMTYVIVVAATYDTAGEICAGVESTQQFRQRNGLVGNASICVDHSFAHALGGINHPWNYVPIDCKLNSSYGAAFWGKFAQYGPEMVRGLAVSALARLRCGGSAAAWKR